MTIRRFLDLSTAHVSEASHEWLNERADENTPESQAFKSGVAGGHHVAHHSFGWWVHVPSEPDYFPKDIPKDVRKVLEHASLMRCDYVLLDTDAAILDELEIYEDLSNEN